MSKLVPLEAERAVLGVAMVFADLAPTVFDSLTAAHFGLDHHQRLAELLLAMWGRGQPIDHLTVVGEVRSLGPDRFGGVPYVASLVDDVPPSPAIDDHVSQVRDMSERRHLVDLAQEMERQAVGSGDTERASPAAIIADMTLKLHRAAGESERDSFTAAEAYGQMLAGIEAAEQGESAAMSTGLPNLDGMLGGGLYSHELVIVGARPGVGKTAFALQLAERWSTAGYPGAFFSQEMQAASLMMRIAQRHTKTPMSLMRSGQVEQADWDALVSLGEDHVPLMDLRIDHRSGQTVAQIRTQVRRWKQRGADLRFVVVDYLQLQSDDRGSRHRTQASALEEVTDGLKDLAMTEGLCVVALSQLNRDSAKEDRPPRVVDLRSSGGIEQSADVILLLHRVGPDAELIVGKQRQGATGTVQALWRPDLQAFVARDLL